MGRNKTRKKNQRSGQVAEEQDPDISETEPSSSSADNVSNSLNETIVPSSSSNVMDTDVEDSEQTTGDSTPADDDQHPNPDDASASEAQKFSFTFKLNAEDNSEVVPEASSSSNQWLVEKNEPSTSKSQSPPQPPSVSCTHIKSSTSMPGLRKSMKNDLQVVCSARPCISNADLGAGEKEVSSKDLWICMQCGNFGCGDQSAHGGDAETHFKTPRSDEHNLVLRLAEDLEKSWCWCYNCKTFVDTKQSALKDAVQFLKRHPKVKSSLQSKVKTPVIPLGPPPPPPQPEISTSEPTHFKSSMNGKKMNGRNQRNPYSSNWDNTNRDEWPLGLDNLGNTCFMNSALQCLSRTRSLIPKLDLYGTGDTLEILVTAEPPSVEVQGSTTPDSNGDYAANLFGLGSSTDGTSMEENGETNGVTSTTTTEGETGGSSPSSSEMDSLLDVASGSASSKSSPSKELSPDNYKDEIEKELKKCLRLKLTIPKDSMTARLRHAFKAMTRSADVQSNTYSGTSEYFGQRGRHVFTPSSIHNAMAKHFRPGQQHDSHELLRTVVDMMKKDQIKAFRLAIMQCYGIKKSEGKNCDPKVAELLKQWDRRLYHKTFVDEIFGGELVTFQTCLTCNSVRRSHEDFLDLSLPIRVYTKNQFPKRAYSLFDDDGDSNRSLEDCLKSFIEPEQLTGSNAVECENCHKTNLEKLANGTSFEDVFPGVKPPVPPNPPETIKKPVVVEPPALETEMDALEPLVMEEENPQTFSNNSGEEMDDFDDLPMAVDGILGNTSDIEDEGNDVPPVFLPDEEGQYQEKRMATAEFIKSSDPHNKENMSLSLAATQDEGFSESDSSEEKKSASISASSSRNSISEAENGATLTSQQKNKEISKPIPITKCPCSRRQMVSRPPECLTIHLKRFQITSHGTSKLGDRINFPYILNLTPFCARDEEDLQRLNGHDVLDEDGEVKYALYGIVEHSGSLHWGHYVAYIKVPGHTATGTIEGEDEGTSSSSSSSEQVKPDKWFYISDSSVSPSSLESVLGMDPYILFYERIRGQEKKDRLNQLQRLNNPTYSSSSVIEATATTATATATTSSSTTGLVAGYSLTVNSDSGSSANSLD